MNKKVIVSFRLNGKETDVLVEPRELLIHTLREKCLHTGPHIGCETSLCGARKCLRQPDSRPLSHRSALRLL